MGLRSFSSVVSELFHPSAVDMLLHWQVVCEGYKISCLYVAPLVRRDPRDLQVPSSEMQPAAE